MTMDARPNENRDNVGNVDQMVEFEHVDYDLPVPLTDQERLQICEDIASSQMKGEQAEKDKKAADDGYKAIIEESYADVSNLTQTIRRGKVDRMVQCEIKKDYRLGHIRVSRMDTYEVIESRPMTTQERQMGMKFPDDKKGKAH